MTRCDMIVASTPEWFTIGKQRVAGMPLRNRRKHAVSMCMVEAGHLQPRWLHPSGDDLGDDYLEPLYPSELVEASLDERLQYASALTKAIDLVTGRLGWPS